MSGPKPSQRAENSGRQALRADNEMFPALVESRRYRTEEWFIDPVGSIELCNVPLVARRVD